MKNEKQWCLYSDKEQTELLACAYEEDQIVFESQYYSEGCWFEYDVEKTEKESEILINERKYRKKVRFPKEPLERPNTGEDLYQTSQDWKSMKNAMGTADIR